MEAQRGGLLSNLQEKGLALGDMFSPSPDVVQVHSLQTHHLLHPAGETGELLAPKSSNPDTFHSPREPHL